MEGVGEVLPEENLLSHQQQDQQHELKLESKLNDLEYQLKVRNLELEQLKQESCQLENDNDSLKTRSLDLIKINQKGETFELLKLKGVLRELKAAEKNIQLELQALNSQVNDEQHKSLRMENLLSVRGEFIKSLQDTDEVLKARLILQAQELDDLRMKSEKFKKFKAATNEELQNLKNTISNQSYEIESLRRVLEDKDEKLQELKIKFKAVESK